MDFNRYRDQLADRVGRLELPFEDSEYARRRDGVARAMDDAGLAALLVTDAADICYLTGYNTFEVSVHTALLLTAGAHGRAVLQVPSIETGPAVTTARVDEVVGYRWEAANGAVEQMADIIRDAGVVTADRPKLGTDNWGPALRSGFRDGLAAALPAVTLTEPRGWWMPSKSSKARRKSPCCGQAPASPRPASPPPTA